MHCSNWNYGCKWSGEDDEWINNGGCEFHTARRDHFTARQLMMMDGPC